MEVSIWQLRVRICLASASFSCVVGWLARHWGMLFCLETVEDGALDVGYLGTGFWRNAFLFSVQLLLPNQYVGMLVLAVLWDLWHGGNSCPS